MTSPDLKTCILFPNLPVELRLRIWALACFHNRIIDIKLELTGDHPPPDTGFMGIEDHPFDLGSTYAAPPGILHTSREAQQVALQHYVLAFQLTGCPEHLIRDRPQKVPILKEQGIYINWEYDIICPAVSRDIQARFGWEYLPFAFEKCQGIRRLGLDARGDANFQLWLQVGAEHDIDYSVMLFSDTSSWPNLKEFIFYLPQADIELDRARRHEIHPLEFMPIDGFANSHQLKAAGLSQFESDIFLAKCLVHTVSRNDKRSWRCFAKWRAEHKSVADSYMILQATTR